MSTVELEAVRRAILEGSYRISLHYLQDRAGDPGRPLPSEIVEGIARDAPSIEYDDHGEADARGAVCHVACMTASGAWMRVVLSYEREPVGVITAYFIDMPAEEPQ